MLEQAFGLDRQCSPSRYQDPHNIATARSHFWLVIHGNNRSSEAVLPCPTRPHTPCLYRQLLTEDLDPQEAPSLLVRHLAGQAHIALVIQLVGLLQIQAPRAISTDDRLHPSGQLLSEIRATALLPGQAHAAYARSSPWPTAPCLGTPAANRRWVRRSCTKSSPLSVPS